MTNVNISRIKRRYTFQNEEEVLLKHQPTYVHTGRERSVRGSKEKYVPLNHFVIELSNVLSRLTLEAIEAPRKVRVLKLFTPGAEKQQITMPKCSRPAAFSGPRDRTMRPMICSTSYGGRACLNCSVI